jgi:hypothetical protein
VGEEIASQRMIRGVAAVPADREVASETKDLEREAVAAEAPKPSAAASEAAEVAGAKGQSATPAKSTAQGAAHSGDREENAAQREDRVAPTAPADQRPTPSLKGPTTVVPREPSVASPEPAKPSIAASEATGPGAKGGPAVPSSMGPVIVAQLSASTLAQVVHAQRCMTAGGWGTGAFEGFASFMAESAMRNSAKAKLGDDVKIGAVRKKCGQKGLLIECTASAQACR